MPGKNTMSEIAKELGLSRQAVSAVINGRAGKLGISPETSERVEKFLESRGYVQSLAALSLKDGVAPIHERAILYSGSDFLRFSHLLQSLNLLANGLCAKLGYVDIGGMDLSRIHEAMKAQVAKGVRRLIWVNVNSCAVERENARRIIPLLANMEKVVIYNFNFHRNPMEEEYLEMGFDLVGPDFDDSEEEVAKLFASLGHRKMGSNEVVFGRENMVPNAHRERSVEPFVKHGIEVFGVFPDFKAEDGPRGELMARHIVDLRGREGVDCVLIRNDQQAAETMKYLLAMGIRIPEDVALMGFNDESFCEYLPVALSSVAIPTKEMCAKSLELLEEPRKGGRGERYAFKCELKLRESHGKGRPL